MTDLHGIDLNLIVVLDAVLAERNLTRAGTRLGMTQPAVSGALSRLRDQLDDELLVRTGHVFALTPTAKRLQPEVERAMTEIRRTLALTLSFDPATTTRTFYIAGSDYTLAELTGPLETLLRAHAPHARIDFEPLPSAHGLIPTDLLRRDVYVAGACPGLPGKHRSLFLDSFVCLVAADHPRLRDREALSLDDLAELRHVHTAFGTGVSTHADHMLASAGIEPRVAITVDGFLQVPLMLAGSTMVGFVPERVALKYASTMGLRIVKTPIPPMTLVETAYWHPSRHRDPAVTWLVDMLLQASEVVEYGAV
ncbi:MAG: LysR family transcriptional regulator [Nocardioides sp.]|uniref:LysR family transcriptional regulator n=1 Tax=Nocardioides sp. TaxID=35761 RepID=UPI0039E68451